MSRKYFLKRWYSNSDIKKKKEAEKERKKERNEIVVILELWGRMGNRWKQCWSHRMGCIIQQGPWFLLSIVGRYRYHGCLFHFPSFRFQLKLSLILLFPLKWDKPVRKHFLFWYTSPKHYIYPLWYFLLNAGEVLTN